MRCKKHLTDNTSSVGVCATCLTERLSALIDAQALAEAQFSRSQEAQEDRRKSDAAAAAAAAPPLLAFPRSVSPYISHRKSDYSRPNYNPNLNPNRRRHHHHHTLSDQLFYSTPQVGPTVEFAEERDTSAKRRSWNSCLLYRLFRFRSREAPSSSSSSPNRPSWFSNMLSSPSRQKKDEANRSSVDGGWRPSRLRRCDRGMSPARVSDCGGDEEDYCDFSPEEWRQTPQRATPQGRRGGHSRNVSGLKFCLSPLVRASPSRQWNQKGTIMPPEVVVHGDVRVPVAGPRLSTGALNRSRKIADFGRCNYGHR